MASAPSASPPSSASSRSSCDVFSPRTCVAFLLVLLVAPAYFALDVYINAEAQHRAALNPHGLVSVIARPEPAFQRASPCPAPPSPSTPGAPPSPVVCPAIPSPAPACSKCATLPPVPSPPPPQAPALLPNPSSHKSFLLAITNCNGADMVERLLSLSSLPEYVQPFIFDDASHEDPVDIRDVAAKHGAYVYQTEGPRGLTYAWNSAFYYFKLSPRNYSHMCVTNNDVVIPAGALEELAAMMDAHPEYSVWGPSTMPGGLGAYLRTVGNEVFTPSTPGGIYGMQQLNLMYPGVPPPLRDVVNTAPEEAQYVQDALFASAELQKAMEGGGGAGVAPVLARLNAELEHAKAAAKTAASGTSPAAPAGSGSTDGGGGGIAAAGGAAASSGVASAAWFTGPTAPTGPWATADPASGAPLNAQNKPHGGWAPPRVHEVTKIEQASRHLLGYFLCMSRTSIKKEKSSGDWVRDNLINLHQETDIRDSGWRNGVATRAFVWHSKASTLAQNAQVDRNDLSVCHRRFETKSGTPAATPSASAAVVPPSASPAAASASTSPAPPSPTGSVSAAAVAAIVSASPSAAAAAAAAVSPQVAT